MAPKSPDRYSNLAWLSEQQEAIEQRLFVHRGAEQKPSLYLYDVTSTYIEGQHNALAAWRGVATKKKLPKNRPTRMK
jgi:hypothetical protein